MPMLRHPVQCLPRFCFFLQCPFRQTRPLRHFVAHPRLPALRMAMVGDEKVRSGISISTPPASAANVALIDDSTPSSMRATVSPPATACSRVNPSVCKDCGETQA